MRCALYKADTNGNLLLKFKSYSSYISNSPTAACLLWEGKAAPGGGRLARQWASYVVLGLYPGPRGNFPGPPLFNFSTVYPHCCREQPCAATWARSQVPAASHSQRV